MAGPIRGEHAQGRLPPLRRSEGDSPPLPPLADLKAWQELSLVVTKTMVMYCGMSLSILCVLSWFTLSVSMVHETPVDEGEEVAEFNSNPALPETGTETATKTNLRDHVHDSDFYMFILIVLVGLRGVLLYMAKALQRPIEMKDSPSVGTWLFAALCILVSEFILGLSLLQCLPGVHVLILIFVFVEVIVQAAFMWIVWNFKLEMILTAAAGDP